VGRRSDIKPWALPIYLGLGLAPAVLGILLAGLLWFIVNSLRSYHA
jgi:hypothetical protein